MHFSKLEYLIKLYSKKHMIHKKNYSAIGLMSGTSLDGVDIAWINTDGENIIKPLSFKTYPYSPEERGAIRRAFGRKSAYIYSRNCKGCHTDSANIESVGNAIGEKRNNDAKYLDIVKTAEKIVTDRHIKSLADFLTENKIAVSSLDVIGFHGQTIFHSPEDKFTCQIGDSQKLANKIGVDVIADMRKADIDAGGQGAPLLPLYHRAITSKLDKPVAILNIGGVANMTWVGDNGAIMAFDCGAGNALMDDFIKQRTGDNFDAGGKIAARGKVDYGIIENIINDDFFSKGAPKSIDRDYWNIDCVSDLSLEDGLATLMEITVAGIKQSLKILPSYPRAIYVSGGGRLNTHLMDKLKADIGKEFAINIEPIDKLGWNGDALEAQGFAYLAVRSVLSLPLTEPSTTGVCKPLTGGTLYKSSLKSD